MYFFFRCYSGLLLRENWALVINLMSVPAVQNNNGQQYDQTSCKTRIKLKKFQIPETVIVMTVLTYHWNQLTIATLFKWTLQVFLCHNQRLCRIPLEQNKKLWVLSITIIYYLYGYLSKFWYLLITNIMNCAVPENVHTLPMEGRWKYQKIWVTQKQKLLK